jgi:hypothetical protein
MIRFKRDRRFRLDVLISERSFVKAEDANGRLSLERVRYREVKFGRFGRVGMVSSAKVALGDE